MEIKIGEMNVKFTDENEIFSSIDEKTGEVKLRDLEKNRPSMGTLCSRIVNHLNHLANDNNILLKRLWTILSGSHIFVHDGGSYLNSKDKKYVIGQQIGIDGNESILLNYDYFMDTINFLDKEGEKLVYEGHKDDVNRQKLLIFNLLPAMDIIFTATLLHELGHFLESRSNQCGKIKKGDNLHFEKNELIDIFVQLKNQCIKPYDRSDKICGNAIVNYFENNIKYQEDDTEIVAVAIEMYILFKLIDIYYKKSDLVLNIIKYIEEKLEKILNILYPGRK
jgi:hypothetical protein